MTYCLKNKILFRFNKWKYLILLLLLFLTVNAFCQKYPTKEITINYSNGINVFSVCISNPIIYFNETKKYFWYSELSGSSEIKNTQGGCGGNLLHGKERFYSVNGDLLFERNYSLGLLEGESKYWDSATGKLEKIYRYTNGICTYRKMKVEDGWFEDDNGFYLREGYTKKKYDEKNYLTSESIYKNNTYTTKEYYKDSKKVRVQYSTPFWCDSCFRGKYIYFYENGNKQVVGQYSDSLENVKIGVWKWYTEKGIVDLQENYKEELQKWPNGNLKVTGGYFFDALLKKWLKVGKWHYYDEDSNLLSTKYFNLDVEIDE
jgi:antitoxin component YwqK of YwqJK toxin-antitoxin module